MIKLEILCNFRLLILILIVQFAYPEEYYYIGNNYTIDVEGARIFTEYYSVNPLHVDISINSGSTFLSIGCTEWNEYDCTLDPGCASDDSQNLTAVYPLFSVSGSFGSINFCQDVNGSNTSVILAS